MKRAQMSKKNTSLILSNEQTRYIAIHCAGLSHAPHGPCNQEVLLGTIKALGYVQLDPLQVIARAHDHILWSRNNQYKPSMLEQSLKDDRTVFEHFCHDACILPVDTLVYWQNQFKRQSEKRTGEQWRTGLTKQQQASILNRIKQEGPLRSNDFKSVKQKTPNEVWSKPEHKKILDYLWLNGTLAVSSRHRFSKYYDLAERVYPVIDKANQKSAKECVDWLCNHALNNLGFANAGEIMRFWDAFDLITAKHWTEKQNDVLLTVEATAANGTCDVFVAKRDMQSILNDPPKPTRRLRLMNPFDPLIRDRKRLARVFGFDYRIEIYTPPVKRQYGYYVYPLLEFDSFVGRIEAKHDRDKNVIRIDNLWPEPGVKFGKARMARLKSEMERVRRFCRADNVVWQH